MYYNAVPSLQLSAIELFASLVRNRRLQLGLSQEELAERAGLDRTYISGIERGKRNPTLRTAERIASALGTDLASLLRKS